MLLVRTKHDPPIFEVRKLPTNWQRQCNSIAATIFKKTGKARYGSKILFRGPSRVLIGGGSAQNLLITDSIIRALRSKYQNILGIQGIQGQIRDFGQGGPSGVLVRGGSLSPKFAQNRGFPLKIAWKLRDFDKKSLGQGGPGPPGPPGSAGVFVTTICKRTDRQISQPATRDCCFCQKPHTKVWMPCGLNRQICGMLLDTCLKHFDFSWNFYFTAKVSKNTQLHHLRPSNS